MDCRLMCSVLVGVCGDINGYNKFTQGSLKINKWWKGSLKIFILRGMNTKDSSQQKFNYCLFSKFCYIALLNIFIPDCSIACGEGCPPNLVLAYPLSLGTHLPLMTQKLSLTAKLQHLKITFFENGLHFTWLNVYFGNISLIH